MIWRLSLDSKLARARRRLVLAGAVLATAVLAPAAHATCPSQALTTPFAKWGDAGSYFFAPNGGFESGLTSWTAGGGAAVVSGNEGVFIHSTADRYSMRLPAGGWARTTTICTNVTDETLRLMIKGPASGSQLKVDALIVSGGNIRTWSTQIDTNGSTAWRPSPPIQFSQGSSQYYGDTTVQLTFTALNSTWQIDDVYIDPLKGH